MSIGTVYGEPPFHYSRDIEVNVLFESDQEAISRLLPPPLEVEDHCVGYLRIVRHRMSPFGPYTGAYLGAVARYQDQVVGHMFTGVKNDFAGAVAGREIWGMPIQLGEVSLEWDGELLDIVVGRSAHSPFATVSLQLGERSDKWSKPTLATFAPTFGHYASDGARHLVGVETHSSIEGAELWRADARVAVSGGTPLDDWTEVPVGRVVRAMVTTGGHITLPAGQLLESWSEDAR